MGNVRPLHGEATGMSVGPAPGKGSIGGHYLVSSLVTNGKKVPTPAAANVLVGSALPPAFLWVICVFPGHGALTPQSPGQPPME
jgi:hypothetical protein